MHKYTKPNTQEKTIYFILALISIAISIGISLYVKGIDIIVKSLKDFLIVIYSGMPFPIYKGIQWAFDKWLWKLPLINQIINVPNLNGVYKGQLKSSYDNFQQPKDFTLIIKQTFSEISIIFKTDTSESKSISAYLKKEMDKSLLVYDYHNEPTKVSIDTLNEHKGTTWIKFDEKSCSFSGRYYTDKRPTKEKAICNYGEIEGKKKCQ